MIHLSLVPIVWDVAVFVRYPVQSSVGLQATYVLRTFPESPGQREDSTCLRIGQDSLTKLYIYSTLLLLLLIRRCIIPKLKKCH
jgi:hypothetical protein